MRKITSLLMLFCMCVGMAWAGPTDLPEISANGVYKYYTISNTRSTSGDYLYYAVAGNTLKDKNNIGVESVFYLEDAGNGKYYICNLATDQKLAGHNSWSNEGTTFTITVTPHSSNAGLAIGFSNTYLNEQNSADGFTTWGADDAGSIFVFEEITDDAIVTAFNETKSAVAGYINNFTSLPVVFTQASTIKSEVEELTASTVAEASANAKLACSKYVTAVNEANGKNVKFCNKATDGRGGRYLGYDNGNQRMAALLSDDDNVVWTLKHVGDGTFKLYNAANNHWLGGPDYKFDENVTENEDGTTTTTQTNHRTPAIENENDAVVYKFVVTAENVVCLVPNGTGKMVHVSNNAGNNYPIMNYYSTTDAASLWNVTVISSKEVTNASYTTFVNSKKTVLDGFITYAKQLQDNYGLVKDGANLEVVINHPDGGDCQPSSNLLDGNNSTFVHSSYAAGANAVTYHYIKAHLSEAKQKVFFYLSKRNTNNRPLKVNVYASNDGETFPTTPAATLIMTESQDNSIQSYFTEAIDLGAAYEYLKFEVVNTNTNTQYFTLSEFYILPVLEETTKNVSDLTSTSVFANNADAYLTAANKYYSTLKLPDLKAEIAAFLEANEDNIQTVEESAQKPKLGQYPYGDYFELSQGLGLENVTLGDLQNAFETFKKSKNLPVFMITGPKDYVVGKSIYDDPERVNAKGNTLYFKTTNIYDKTMWWAMDIAETTVGATHLNKEIALYNVGTGKDFWNSSIKLTETNENEGAGIADDNIFLMYTTSDASYPVHFQSDGALMTRWGSYEATSASAMKFVYVGESYDLKNLPASLFTAAEELAALNVPNFTFSEGLNEYDPATKPALDAAIANRTTVLSKLSTAEELAAAKAQLETAIDGVQLNMPVNGKFYRLRCVDGKKYLQCTQNTDENRFDMIAGSGGAGTTVTATFCYINGGLVAYSKPMYIGHESNNASFNMEPVAIKFQKAGDGTLGQYNIKLGTRYLYGKNDKSDSGAYNGETLTATDGGYRWWLEEVNEIPVTITEAGYASFYAPVEVTLPTGVTAHTVTENDEWATLSDAISVVPAENGVILAGEAGTYNLTVSNTNADDLEGALAGTVAKTLVTKETGAAYYVLGVKDEVVGLYNPVIGEDNTKFYNAGFKAYWYIPATSQTAGFRFGGETTAIDAVEVENANAPIYDLSGRRVLSTVKGGIYIQNGKKFIVK